MDNKKNTNRSQSNQRDRASNGEFVSKSTGTNKAGAKKDGSQKASK